MKKTILFALAIFQLINSTYAQTVARQYEPVSFSKVQITDAFWHPQQEKVATATLKACIEQTEVKTPRIRNFENAAKHSGKFEGIYYDDSDVYKALEAIAYSLKNHPDPAIELKADEWIDKIAAAQQPDGYLNTYFTLNTEEKRWTDMEKHEDYNAGHLIEAAVAYYNTTGKRKLLDVAIRLADHIDQQFRIPNRHWVTGHQEIELALAKLYHVTNEKRYIQLATWLLEQRGHGYGKGAIWDEWKDPLYCQDLNPVKEQKEISGHAVRAMYMYTGAADVATATGDAGYMNAMKAVWEDVVYRNMYLTGGIGSSGGNEGFSTDYDLPNENAYCETCASVGMVFWNQRMNLLTGESKYADVLERSLYNGALDGLSLTGDRFFYGNPLASNGRHARREWFGTACCPANIARLVASVGDYIYGSSANSVWVNLYVGSNTKIPLEQGEVQITQTTNFPWDGVVKIQVSSAAKQTFALRMRIPGWAQNEATPGGLYHFSKPLKSGYSIKVNGKAVTATMDRGYAVLEQVWNPGDVVELTLPMEVRQVEASENIKADIGRAAIQRGPLLYCVEGADNKGQAWNILLPANAQFKPLLQPKLLGGVVTLSSVLPVMQPAKDGMSILAQPTNVTAIPYYVWCNRGSNPMQVWLPRKIKEVDVK
jgi:DUF1680 family protein